MGGGRSRDGWGCRRPEGESYAEVKVGRQGGLEELDRDTIVVSDGGVFRVLNHLIAGTPAEAAPELPVPQDRIAVFRGDSVELL